MYRPYIYKTAFLCDYGQLAYTRIGQGLTRSCRTYSKLKNLVIGPIPSLNVEPLLKEVNLLKVAFTHFVDDNIEVADTFKEMLKFLYKHYFLRVY